MRSSLITTSDRNVQSMQIARRKRALPDDDMTTCIFARSFVEIFYRLHTLSAHLDVGR